MINIYDVNGKVLMQAEITSSAIREEELSKSDYISLSWNSAEKVILPAEAYIVHTYKIDKVREVTRQFLLLESYEPTQSDEMSWKYTPEFQHQKMVLSKIPFFIRTRNSKNEVVKQYNFDFCGTMVTIADKLKDFLNNELKFGNAGWLINYDTANTNAINVSFSDNDFISALTAITNAIGDNCEWHIDYDNETIHIGNVLRDDLPVVTLKVGENVSIPSVNNSKEDYYNAFAVFGGTRNITQVNDKGENISSSDIKLQLSKGSGITEIDGKKLSYSIDEFSTIDMRQNKNEQLFTKILNFSQIFPSLNTYVYNVRGREKYVLQDGNKIPLTYNADGSVKTYKTFTVWYVRMAYPTTEKIANKKLVNTTVDNGVTHYWYDFEITDDLLINGKNIGCSFEANFNEGALSTPLAGRGINGDYVGFELTYHKEASSTHTTDDVDSSNFAVLAGDFEIIYQEDNDLIIPTNAKDMIIPKGESLPSYKCNITVLYNIAMAESIYTEDAQKRLLDAAMKDIKRLLSDLNNYSVKSYPQVFEAKNPCLQIGQKVVYDDGNGYQLDTRVQKISTNIDFEFVQEITIGNEVIKGNTAQLREDVKEIIASGGSGSGGGGNYTTSQLRNLISKYGIGYFVSKLFDDVAKGLITFEQGIKLGAGTLWKITLDGVAELRKLIIDEDVEVKGDTKLGENGTNTVFGDYATDSTGARIQVKEDGTSIAEFDYITIRRAAQFRDITIRELRHIGGELAITPAAMVCSKVERLNSKGEVIANGDNTEPSSFKCYFETKDSDEGSEKVFNYFRPLDQARCQQFDIVADGSKKTRYYWRLVMSVGKDYIVLSNLANGGMDSLTTSEPLVGDNIVQLGYQGSDDPNRQSAIILSSTSDDAPSQKMYQGISSFSLDGCLVKDEGYDAATGVFHCNIYGDSFIGGKDSYFTYDSKQKKATFKGTVNFERDSTLPDGSPVNDIAKKDDLKDLNIKSGNLLRNTSFCGDYESIDIFEDTEISEDKETFSEKLKYWTMENASVIDTKDSTSGKAVRIGGTLSQQLAQPLLAGKAYVLSFKGKGTTVRVSVGGEAHDVDMTSSFERYELHITCSDANAVFSMVSTNCVVCEIMLSYGKLAPAWSPSYSDNDKSMAEFQNMKFLTDAITQGSTTIDGGLVMSQQFKVGNFRDKKMIKETGGMSGYYNDDDSPFLWGGGTLEQAIYTIQKYKDNPNYEPTAEELNNLAKFVVTHGGRALLTDIILRGIIYAEGGVMKSIKSPNGNFEIDEEGNAKLNGEINSTSGSIGGFEIGFNRIGFKQNFDDNGNLPNSSANQMSLYLSELIFNSKDRQAIIGCCTHYDDFLLRLIDTKRDMMPRYGGIVGVQGSSDENVAMEYIGGWLSGVNFKNIICGFRHYAYSTSQPTMPTYKDYEIDRTVNCIYATTKCYWKAKDAKEESDASQWVNIKLPELKWYDDGHEILIKRGLCNDNKVNIQARRFCNLEVKYSDYGKPSYEEVWYDTILLTGRGTYVTEEELGSEMDSVCLRFFKDLSVTITNGDGTKKNYRGVWVEFKHPRDW